MDTATGMEGNVTCQDDGSWSYTWQWAYSGTDSVSGVKEEFIIKNDAGIVDHVDEAAHSADPG